jgi:hypothetical protein
MYTSRIYALILVTDSCNYSVMMLDMSTFSVQLKARIFYRKWSSSFLHTISYFKKHKNTQFNLKYKGLYVTWLCLSQTRFVYYHSIFNMDDLFFGKLLRPALSIELVRTES